MTVKMNQEIKDMKGNVIAQLTRPDRAETLSEKVFENEWFRVKLDGGWNMSTKLGWCENSCSSGVKDITLTRIFSSEGPNSGLIVIWPFLFWKSDTFSIKEIREGVEISGTQTCPYCDENCNPQVSNNELTVTLRNWTPIIEIGINPERVYYPVFACAPLPNNGLTASAWGYDGKELTPYKITQNQGYHTPTMDIANEIGGIVMKRNGWGATTGVIADIEYSKSGFYYWFSGIFYLGLYSVGSFFGFNSEWWFNSICSKKAIYYILYNPYKASTDELIRGYNDVLKIKEEPLFCLPGVILPKTCIYKSRPYVRRE